MELDNLVWQHPLTLARSRGACLLDVGSKLPIVRIHHTVDDRPNAEETLRKNSAPEYIADLVGHWFPDFGKPKIIRTDPGGTFLSKQLKQFTGEHRILASVQPGESHWRTANVERAPAA